MDDIHEDSQLDISAQQLGETAKDFQASGESQDSPHSGEFVASSDETNPDNSLTNLNSKSVELLVESQKHLLTLRQKYTEKIAKK